MHTAGFDAVVAFSIENVYFSSGTMLLTQRMIPSRLAITVTYPDGAASMIVCSIEIAQVQAETWIKDLRTYTEFKDSPIGCLASLLTERGLAAGRIGIESNYLPAAYYRELVELLPNARLSDADKIFDQARAIKSPDEIAIMRKGAIGTDRAIRKAFESAQIGTTEAEMYETMRGEVLKNGADGVAFVVMTTGENSRLVHPTPSSTPIKPGDLVRTDFGAFYGAYFGGYYSDLARLAIAGKPTDRQRDTHKRLREVFELLLRSAKPGVRACDLYELCRKSFEDRGLAFKMPHIGHNIGIFIHENPMLNPLTPDELRPGMVMAIEPITVQDGYIYHCEDELIITETGNELLSPANDWAELMTIS
jgi:Xaa-Pro aminopeptidase